MIWRTAAPGRSEANASNFWLTGSKRTIELLAQSLNQTRSA